MVKVIFVCVLSLIVTVTCAQELDTIPDLNFWNTSYNYSFHYKKIKENNSLSSNGSDLNYSELANRIYTCYQGVSSFGKFPCSNIDTNLSTLLPKAQEIFSKHSIINLDYWDGKDQNFKTLLTYLYNATVNKDKRLRQSYLDKSKKCFDQIPDFSINKSIAYIHIENTDRFLKDISHEDKDIEPLETVYEKAFSMVNAYNFSIQNLADWNECMGDFSYQWGDIAQYKNYYTRAIKLEMQFNDSISCIQLQRIKEKLFWNLNPEEISGNIFSPFVKSIIGELKNPPIKQIEEFQNHNKLIEYFYRKLYDKNAPTVLNSNYLETNSELMPIDIGQFIDAIRSMPKTNRSFELEKKLDVLRINISVKYNLVRFQKYSMLLDHLFFSCLMIKDFENAKLVNQFIENQPQVVYRNNHYQYLLNLAQIQIAENDYVNAKINLNDIINDPNINYNGIIDKEYVKEAYWFLREMAFNQKDIYEYDKLSKQIEKIERIIEDRKKNSTQTTLRNDHYNKVTQLIDEINYYEEWGRQKEIIAHSNMIFARQKDSIAKEEKVKRLISDSLRTSQRLNDSLVQLRDLDIISKQKREKTIFGIGSIFALFITILIMTLYYLYKRDKMKNENEADKRKIESQNVKLESENIKLESEQIKLKSEKIELELESLRTSYLNHTINGPFMQVRNLIRKSIERGDDTGFERAIDVINKIAKLLNEIAHNKTGENSLLNELEYDRQYVEIISQCIGQTIPCKFTILENIGENIILPTFSLLDFYVNAVKHGRLTERKNSYILTTLCKSDEENVFLLAIENNGVGKGEEKDENTDHKSTGHDRV
jgi:hypothetical protein